jgi:quercetin dioxygenase-like cupin family protein
MAIPAQSHDHKDLLTVNTNELPIYKDALPGVPGVDVQPLFLDPNVGIWVLRVIFQPGVTLPRHYHTGPVHFFTLAGKWNYVEYPDQPQTAGSYLYEPGGSVHQFSVPASNTEVTDSVMVVYGANVNFDSEGNYLGLMDASDIMRMIDNLVRERGLEPAKYIKPGPADYTTRG